MCGGAGLSNRFQSPNSAGAGGIYRAEPDRVDWLVGMTTLMRKAHRSYEEFESREQDVL
jgi:hypothetical protein